MSRFTHGGLSEMISIIENQRNHFRIFASLAEEARLQFKRTAKNEILISPDTFNDANFDKIILSREGKLNLSFNQTENSLSVPRGYPELSFVTRIRIESNIPCVVKLISTGDTLKTWIISKDSILEEYCAFPLTGARFSDIKFILEHPGIVEYRQIDITLSGIVFGNKNLELGGQEWSIVAEIFKNDVVVGSCPFFRLRNEIMYLSKEEDILEETHREAQRFSIF